MKYFLYSVIGLAVVSFLLQFIIVHNIPQLLLDNGIDIYSDSYALKESITKKKIYQLIRFSNDYLGQSIIFIFFILFTIIYYRSINYLEKKNQNYSFVKIHIIRNYFVKSLKVFPIYFTFTLIINTPILVSNQIIKSLIYFSNYIIYSPTNYSLSGNILVNAYSWFEDGLKSGFISFFIIVGLMISIYNYIKHLKKNEYI